MTPITQVITLLPRAPDPATDSPAVFSDTAAISVAAQRGLPPEVNTWTGQVNALAGEIDATAQDAADSANSASDSAQEAALSETRAADSVIAAASAANAPLWTAKNYTQGERVSSTVNGRIYRRTTPGVSASATDPSLDPGGWLVISNSLLFMPLVTTATVTAQAGCFYALAGPACTVTAPAAPAAGDTFQAAVCNALTTNVVNWAGLKQENLTDATTTLDVVRVWTFTYINAAYGWRIY